MLEGLTTAFEEIRTQFVEARLIDQLGYITAFVGVTVASVGVVFSTLKFRNARGRLKTALSMVELLTTQNRELEAANSALERRIQETSPTVWLEEAAALARQGDLDASMKRIRTGFENIRAPLAHASLTLANYHFDRSFVRPAELGEATALAQLSTVLTSANAAAAELSLAINEARAASTDPLERYSEDPLWSVSPFADDPEGAALQVHTLAKRAETLFGQGHSHYARRLSARAIAIAEHAHITASPEAAYAMLQHAETLYPYALYGDAMRLLDRALSCPPSNRFFKTHAHAKGLKGQILWRTGDFEKAVSILDEAVIELTNVCSPACHFLFDARMARAQSLSDLNRNSEALVAIEKLIESWDLVVPSSPRLTMAAIQRAQILSRLNNHGDALATYDETMPQLIRQQGEASPHVHWLRHLRADALWQLGRKEEAVAENTKAIAGMSAAVGANHPDTKGFEHTQALWAA